jgi:aspartyl-tRNA(Asn)/glutamyl-tRNA(Gln) amidotransferase subunit A
MRLPKLAEALAEAAADPGRASRLARAAADAVRPHGGDSRSFISVAEDAALGAPLPAGPLLGCIFAAKDNIDVAGLPTTCGSRLLEGVVPDRDAWIVAALRAAGAACIGKNNMHELALGATGINERFGTTACPWDAGRSAGGSSGGSAVAVARRQVHLSLGTDSGGSVRIPAAMCGIVGFKPSGGALPLAGVAGAALTLDSLGLFALEVGDIERVWEVVSPGPEPARVPQGRLAYLCDESMGRVEPAVWERYQDALERLRRGGMQLAGIPMPGLEIAPQVCVAIVYPEVASLHHRLIREHPELYSPDIRALFHLGELWPASLYVDAQRLRIVLRRRLRAMLGDFDAILTPTAAIQPPRLGEPAQVAGDPPGSQLYTFMRFTVALNATGYPAISVPAGLDRDGLPVGLQVIGRPRRERQLLAAARRIEAVLGTMPAPPGVVH